MNKSDWSYRKYLEKRYQAALNKITRKLAQLTEGLYSLEEITRTITGITDQKWFHDYSVGEASKMVKSCLVSNAQTWREASRKGQNSRLIYQSLKAEFENNARFHELIDRNATLFRSLPLDVAKGVSKRASSEALRGLRAESFTDALRAAVPEISQTRAKLIARTEVAKTQAAITQVRSEEMGLDWYVWRTSEDQRVRTSHAHMDGVLCRYSDPPAPEVLVGEKSQGHYGPGMIYNCRCYAETIIDTDDVNLPIKAYVGGKIQRITKRQFLDLQ